ncbi:MAG: DNA mismatch repair endonuclease MutL [Desulfobulbales bacterium]|nr:DNA mismatch repair endonuclease MutL [Desulfobulbales bacterium]
MSQIRILPENLANQIAAGEVVERPASVVKELVENSIDAGAAGLTVQVEGAGASLIRVIDDGRGMDQDDILLSLERHATSKLINVAQLNEIMTLGFRGEAVPSIASVSRLSITSRPLGAELGARVEVRFGKVVKVHEMGCRVGTVVEMRDLFGNVPARKKFLKTPRTELSHIEEVLRGYALARPELALDYFVNGREILAVPPVVGGGLEQRLKNLLGCDSRRSLATVGPASAENGVKISGFLLPPDYFPSQSANLRAFVNGRPVRDRLITHAVAEGLRNFLMKGRRPTGVLFVDLPPAAVDVNVHPAKQEIRFHDGQVVHQLIVLTVGAAMEKFQAELKGAVFGEGSAPEVFGAELPVSAWPEAIPTLSGSEARPEKPVLDHSGKKSADHPAGFYDRIKSKRPDPAVAEPDQPRFGNGWEPVRESLGHSPPIAPAPASRPETTEQSEQALAAGRFRVIGQLLDTYILCEGEEGLVAVDQHAAQERLIFERLKKEFGAGRVTGQTLLFPKTMELGAEEIAILEGSAEEIARMGIDIREFGGNTYVLKAVPAVMGRVPPEEILRGVFDQFAGAAGGRDRGDAARRLDNILSGMACKAAIKARQSLSIAEMKSLLDEMVKNDVFSHCPHGRPVVRKFPVSEIKRWFHRT